MPGRSFVSGQKAKETFTGHELDDESGLVYAGARYYMPNIGRWTSVDPLAAKYPDWSPYNYPANYPLIVIDPDWVPDRSTSTSARPTLPTMG